MLDFRGGGPSQRTYTAEVLDHGRDADGTLYLVTELLDGDKLNEHLHALIRAIGNSEFPH